MSATGGLRRDVVIAVTVIVCAIVAASAAVLISGHGLSDMTGIIGAVALPVLAALGALLAERQKSTDEKVNGRITQMLANHQATVELLASKISEADSLRREPQQQQQPET